MKKFFKFILFAILISVATSVNAQSYTRNGNTFISSKGERVKAEPTNTGFTWKDSKGKEYPIFISNTGSCFIIKTSSKTGKEYRNYLGPEISEQICKELGREYKGKKGNKV